MAAGPHATTVSGVPERDTLLTCVKAPGGASDHALKGALGKIREYAGGSTEPAEKMAVLSEDVEVINALSSFSGYRGSAEIYTLAQFIIDKVFTFLATGLQSTDSRTLATALVKLSRLSMDSVVLFRIAENEKFIQALISCLANTKDTVRLSALVILERLVVPPPCRATLKKNPDLLRSLTAALTLLQSTERGPAILLKASEIGKLLTPALTSTSGSASGTHATDGAGAAGGSGASAVVPPRLFERAATAGTGAPAAPSSGGPRIG